jgi:transketolase
MKPLDEEAIRSAAAYTGAILTVEEQIVSGGLGTVVGEVLARNRLGIPFSILGLPDETLTVGMPDELYTQYGLTVANTAQRMRELLASR